MGHVDGAGIQGTIIVSEDNLDFGERSLFHLGLAGRVDLNPVTVGLHFGIPLDEDLSDFYNNVFGLNVTVPILGK